MTRRMPEKSKQANGAIRSDGASQRMFLDALIAVSARCMNATVVTQDWDDFKAITYYCDVKLKARR